LIEVDVSGPAIPRLPRREIGEFVRKCLAALRRAGAAPVAVSEVSVLFVDDAEMKRINRTWRNEAKTTDVLTFPATDTPTAENGQARPLGDIVICVDQARRQARAERHSLATEIRYLLLHGIIHAHGYDHEQDAGEMDALERKLRPRVGLT
jgi:probable rRNA maturation factor